MVDRYSQFNPSPMSVQNFLDFGRTGDQARSFTFLRKELLVRYFRLLLLRRTNISQVRLANIMKEINLLPNSLLSMPSCKLVQDWYAQSFLDFAEFEAKEINDNTLHMCVYKRILVRFNLCHAVSTRRCHPCSSGIRMLWRPWPR